jgi:hypothetical protein
VNIYVRIAQYYLEEEESVQAEIYIKRAAQFTQDVKDPQLLLRFKVVTLYYHRSHTTCRAVSPVFKTTSVCSWKLR